MRWTVSSTDNCNTGRSAHTFSKDDAEAQNLFVSSNVFNNTKKQVGGRA